MPDRLFATAIFIYFGLEFSVHRTALPHDPFFLGSKVHYSDIAEDRRHI